MHAERVASIASLFGRQNKTPTERLAACVAALDGLSDFGPYEVTHPPFWDIKKHNQIESLRPLSNIDEVRSTAQMFPLVFAAFRTHAHDLEAQNAARLCVLVWSLQTLFAIRHDAELGDEIARVTGRITTALRTRWNIREEDVPIDVPYRSWCSKVTRNYRLLPVAWRWV